MFLSAQSQGTSVQLCEVVRLCLGYLWSDPLLFFILTNFYQMSLLFHHLWGIKQQIHGSTSLHKEHGHYCILIPLFFTLQENKRMKQCLEEELKSRKDLEKLVRRLLKQTDECGREDTGRKSSLIAWIHGEAPGSGVWPQVYFWEVEPDPLPLFAPYFVGLGYFVTKKKKKTTLNKKVIEKK